MTNNDISTFKARFINGNESTRSTWVKLSKTEAQQNGPLKGVKFSDHSSAIKRNSTIEPGYVRVNLPLNGRLYSYTVSFDGDRREIDPNNTFIVPNNDSIVVKIERMMGFKQPA
ncbi:uncharacterized protein LOC128163658 [Crassostrea angulata]|uniref:uncharacterized protein LOC128162436 n=1 Tax=Magallana angulata TaxID=2784310 RepID=UPI0022B086BA|nr:uncharacterized protein LOC128162436 [Crassostrea angulata]XP_052681611.1 uncharacterized protein LOC128162436 [Crassostrea angulata]XP_052683242.1 uncharacterized protein LOC128163657 [Crassostrea angulata]XP_052683243.1 uncharacterized protein LOC128163658 [Crassostrea angulata]